jgi:hypothetical protein
MRARPGRLEKQVGPPPACAACAGRKGLIVLVSARRFLDGTAVPKGDQPTPCEECGTAPEFLIEVVEIVVDSAGNPI